MFKKFCKKFSISLLLFLLLPVTNAFAEDNNEKIILSSLKNFSTGSDKLHENFPDGWVQEIDEKGNLKLYYYDSDNTKHIGWLDDNGKFYYFDSDGNLSTNYYSKVSAN